MEHQNSSRKTLRKSKKRIFELTEIVSPYILTPAVNISGNVNGVPFYFPRGKPSEVTLSQYEVLVNSSYAKELRS